MVSSPKQSPFYNPRPIFVPSTDSPKRSRLQGSAVLIVVAALVLVVAAAAGIWYFRQGLQTSVFSGPTPFQQQTQPLLPR
ncbi:MAG: hypothetical protein U0514_01550 [Candidatus Andersenbacteria bacterium]